MSNLTSKYSIDLVINDDKTNDSIRKLKAELNNITSAQDMSQSLSATNDLIAKLDQFAKEANNDFGTIIKEYSKSSSKAIDKLMDRYTELKIRQESLTKEQIEQNELLKKSANELEKN